MNQLMSTPVYQASVFRALRSEMPWWSGGPQLTDLVCTHSHCLSTHVHNDMRCTSKYTLSLCPVQSETRPFGEITSDLCFRYSIYTGWSKILCAPDDYSTKNTQKYSILNSFITEHIQNADRAILNTVFENTVRRVNKCLETGRGHFEHYL